MSQAVRLDVEAQLAAAAPTQSDSLEAVRFEGVAVGTGVYTAAGGLQIRIEGRHLPLIAERLADVQIRDLHEERIEATVGAVRAALVEGEDVVFEGEVALEPHATIIRRFPETVRFSVGFRFSATDLAFGPDDVAPLPEDFIIDHIAIVGQGQDPDARLTKLLNEAKQSLAHPTGDGTVDKDTAAELRRQRDQALEAEKQARADLAKAETRLENTNEKLELAEQAKQEAVDAAEQARTEAESARLDLQRAKAGFATSIMKLELQAGEDLDLHERQNELLGMELSELDQLRLELAEAAAERRAVTDGDDGPATKPTAGQPVGGGQALDLEELSMEDTLRLGLVKGVL